MPRRLLLFTIVFLAFVPAFSQPLQYKFTRLNVNNGLSNNQVTCLLKDRQGFIWIGTTSGLNRYDGYSARVFRNDLRDTTTISNSYITSLAEDPEGRIWINSVNSVSSINIYNPTTESFSLNAANILTGYGIPPGIVNDIVKDSKGNFWFILSDGLYKYIPSEKRSLHGSVLTRSRPFQKTAKEISGSFSGMVRC
jgi:ligand-binding sensor domain-containing protein